MKNDIELGKQIFFGALGDTLEDLKEIIENKSLKDELHQKRDELCHIYKNLTSYISQGIVESNQEQLVSYIQKELLSLISSIRYEASKKTAGNYYFQVAQIVENGSLLYSIAHIQSAIGGNRSREDYDRQINYLFESLWVNRKLSDDEMIYLQQSSEYVKKIAASALTLSLMEFWDVNKLFYAIKELSTPISDSYRVRLIWLLFIAINRYPYHIAVYQKELTELFQQADDYFPLTEPIRQLYFKYLVVLRTDQDLQGLQSDLQAISSQILPHFMNQSPLSQSQDVISLQELVEQISPEDPLFEKLQGKMNQLSHYEENGADIMYLSMGQMKSFPFFSSISSWFLPFDPNHSSLSNLPPQFDMSPEEIALFVSELCDSDAYSLFFSFEHLPFAGNEKMKEMLIAGLRQRREDKEEKMSFSTAASIEQETIKYLRNLYRFYHLYSERGLFVSPFRTSFLNFTSMEEWGVSDIKMDVAIFYFKHENYSQAIDLLLQLLPDKRTNPDLYWLLGVCSFKLDRYSDAISYLLQADLLTPNNPSVINYLATSYKKIGDLPRSISFFEKMRKIRPQDTSILLALSRLYIENKEEEKALPLLYQYEVTEPHPQKAYSLIAWSLFLRRDFEKSESYYKKMLSASPDTALLHINLGHLFLVQNDTHRAFEQYSQALSLSTYKEWESEMKKDFSTLFSLGVSQSFLHLIMDTVKIQNSK